MGTQNDHFLAAIALMLFFFLVSTAEQLLFALHITASLVGNGDAANAYILFSGIAVGMMRGMQPDASKPTAPKAPG